MEADHTEQCGHHQRQTYKWHTCVENTVSSLKLVPQRHTAWKCRLVKLSVLALCLL